MKQIKNSEKRIIIYLNQVEQHFKYTRMMSAKLNIDYSYIIGLLLGMENKGWLIRQKRNGKTFYELTKIAPQIQDTGLDDN